MRPALLLAAAGLLLAQAPSAAHDAAHHEGPPSPVVADPLAGHFGGAFALTDTNGRRVTDRDFHGRFLLIYFGYTRCVDVCPVDLAVQQRALQELGPLAAGVASVFVTVDPARDTPEVIDAFLSSFGPDVIGLTGTEAEIAAAAKAFRVHRRKIGLDHPDAQHLKEMAGAYIVDHGSLTYLMGPDGRFATLIPHGLAPDAVAGILKPYLAEAATAVR